MLSVLTLPICCSWERAKGVNTFNDQLYPFQKIPSSTSARTRQMDKINLFLQIFILYPVMNMNLKVQFNQKGRYITDI